MPASEAQILFVSASWGGAVGVAVGYDYQYTREFVTLRNEDSVNPDVRTTVRKDVVCNVQFLDFSSNPAESDTAASLVLTTRKADGNTETVTVANVIPQNYSGSFNREAPPAVFTVTFVGKGAVSKPS